MSDFATRITTLVDAAAPPVDIDALVQQLESATEIPGAPPVLPQRRSNNWVVAVGAAIAVFILIGGFVWLVSGTGSDVVEEPIPAVSTTPAVATTAPPTPTTAPTTIPSSIGALRDAGSAEAAGWTFIYPPANDWQRVGRLASGTWVALDRGWQCRTADGFHQKCHWDGLPGYSEPLRDADAEADPTEILWTSTDGIEWTSSDIPEFAGKLIHPVPHPQYATDVYGGLLWVWASPLDAAAPTEVWITEDAETWHQVQWIDVSDPPPPSPGNMPYIQAASRSGDVIFLSALRGATLQHLVSTDAGRTFTGVTPFPNGTYTMAHWAADGQIQALVATPNQGFALWRSDDGSDWNRIGTVEGLDSAPTSQPLLLSSSSDALIADTGWRTCDVQLVRSTDGGLTWENIDVFGELPIHYTETRFILTPNPCAQYSAATAGWMLIQSNDLVWVSRDGVDWYTIDGDLEQFSDFHLVLVYTDQGWPQPPAE
jgi:hypothetical protein